MCTESPGLCITAATGPSLCASVARSKLGAGTGGFLDGILDQMGFPDAKHPEKGKPGAPIRKPGK